LRRANGGDDLVVVDGGLGQPKYLRLSRVVFRSAADWREESDFVPIADAVMIKGEFFVDGGQRESQIVGRGRLA